MKATLCRGMPDLSPIPAPFVRRDETHRRLCRYADRHGLDMVDPGDRVTLLTLMGWDPAPDHVPESWRRRMTNADRLRAMQRLAQG